MYTPSHFEMPRAEALDFVRRRGFGTLVSPGAEGLLATPLPLLLEEHPDGTPRLVGHVARANPHWRNFDPGQPSLALFEGGDAYVTPAWYAAKAETGKVVPTWNYVSVHLRGPLRVVEDPDELLGIVSRLTDHHEAPRDRPWSTTDAPEDYTRSMLRAIVGIVLRVDQVEGKAKLSQNRPAADRTAVRDGLAGKLAIPVEP